MVNLDKEYINRHGRWVSLYEIQQDINCALKKGYHPNNDFAFTTATVQGLLDQLILELETNKKQKQYINSPALAFKGCYSYYFTKLASSSQLYMNYKSFCEIENDEKLAHLFLVMCRLVEPTHELKFSNFASETHTVSLNVPNLKETPSVQHLNLASKEFICIHPVIWLAYIGRKIASVDEDLKYNYLELRKSQNPYIVDLLIEVDKWLSELSF